MIELPKPDKRYKVGKIVKDKKGNYRGHPTTVIPKTMDILTNIHLDNYALSLYPPKIVSHELAEYITAQSKIKDK